MREVHQADYTLVVGTTVLGVVAGLSFFGTKATEQNLLTVFFMLSPVSRHRKTLLLLVLQLTKEQFASVP